MGAAADRVGVLLCPTHNISITLPGLPGHRQLRPGNLGGGIYSSSAIIVSSQFEDNQAINNWGGGIFAGQTAAVTDTNFLRNSSKFAGGGLAIQFGAGQVTGGRFEGNTIASDGWGGAIYAGGPTLTIQGTQFFTNTSQIYGGAVASNNTTITGARFNGNSTGGSGGALSLFGPAQIATSLFKQNSSAAMAGQFMPRTP